MTRLPCCATWDDCELIAETPLMHARLDAYPVAEGHALVIPKRHVDRFTHLTDGEMAQLRWLVDMACERAAVEDFTIAVNDGPLAGRTVPHLHVHVIPRRAGDVADPRGGVRRLLIPDAGQDPWLIKEVHDRHRPAGDRGVKGINVMHGAGCVAIQADEPVPTVIALTADEADQLAERLHRHAQYAREFDERTEGGEV